jgi:hypothetical protein
MTTMADGIAVGRPGDVPFALVQHVVDDVVLVDEESLSRALVHCLERAKLVIEPAGAAALAAVMDDPTAFEPPVVVRAVRRQHRPAAARQGDPHGLISGGRFLSLRVRIPDRPASWRCCSPCWPTAARTCSTSSTRAPVRACTSARSRSSCSWRPAAGRTATPLVAALLDERLPVTPF